MKRILMIEDDSTIVYGLSRLLREEGFLVEAAGTLKQAMALQDAGNLREDSVNMSGFCLVLLDLSLPDGEGWAFLERLLGKEPALEPKAPKRKIPPVIILTARDEESDIIRGLDMGADDYVTKPFKAGVLLSRIRAVLRRQETFSENDRVLTCGNILLNREKTTVTAGGEEVLLTAGEFRLLAYLMENKNRTLTRSTLLARFWDMDGDYVNDNTLSVTMKRLREKLGENSRGMLKTVRGIGYKLEDGNDA